jgi:glycosyltransferase involved in cell wall biosynthesis
MESVLFVSTYCPGDRAFGSDTRIRGVLEWMTQGGMKVHFVHVTRKFFPRPPLKVMPCWFASYHPLNVAGCAATADQPREWKLITRPRSLGFHRYWSQRRRGGQSLGACLEELLRRTRAKILWVNHTVLAPVVAELPQRDEVLRILDTHDVLHLRDARFRTAGVRPEQDIALRVERELLSLFDVILAIQDCERDVLKRMVPDRTVLTLGHAHDVAPQHGTSLDVGFVGSDYVVNEKGLLAFLKDAWPAICERHPATRLQIAGGISKSSAIIARAQHDRRLVLRGIVPRLADIYAEPAVMICPMWFGSGLKIKMVEALAHGKAVVASPLAAEGLEDGAPTAFLLAEEPRDFAPAVLRLLGDEPLRRRFEVSAAEYAGATFSAERVWRELNQFLHGWQAARQLRRAA